MGNTKRGRLYLRISDDREGRQIGVTRQEIDGRELAARHGIEIVGVYCDNDISASTLSTTPRPDYARMLAAAEADPGSFILAYSNGRLTRRPRDFEDLIELHDRARIKYLTKVSGEDDLATADGRMVARMKAVVDAAEAERISERVTRASRHRAETGQGHGGTRPYGWRADDRTLLDPYEHAVKTEIKDRLFAGDSCRKIAADLTRRGVPTSSWHPPLVVKPWSVPAITAMMTNWRQCGYRVYRGQIVGEGNWQPAFDEATVRQLRQLLLDPSRRTTPGNGRVHLLPGVATCGDCGGAITTKIVTQKGRPKRTRYQCPACGIYRTMAPIDLYVTAYVKRLLRQYQPEPDPGADPAAELEVTQIRARIDSTIERFTGSDALSADQLEEILRGLNARLAEAEARAVPPRPLAPVLDGLTGEAPAVDFDALTLDRKRAVIDRLVTVQIHRSVRGRRGFDPETVTVERRRG
jgi:site-specific DNA recombinase